MRYVTAFRDRHGKMRYRFRRKGYAGGYFKAKPGTRAFEAELKAFNAAPIDYAAERIVPGTFHDLIARFYRSTHWRGAESTKRTYRGIIERFREAHGHRLVRDLRYVHVDAILARMADTPAAANNLRKVLRRLMDFAVKIEMAERNPVNATEPFRTNPDGFHTWTETEIALFEARHPLGTKARLAMALMLWTGQRRSDIIGMGRQHVTGGRIRVRQQKTGKALTIPIAPQLKAALDAMPVSGHMTFLVTEFGKPFTSNGFGNWFRRRCNEAGLKGCSAHGLRKAISRRMAESGLSHSEGKAVTGHVTDREFSRYSRDADQVVLADRAVGKLSNRQNEEVSNLGQTNEQ